MLKNKPFAFLHVLLGTIQFTATRPPKILAPPATIHAKHGTQSSVKAQIEASTTNHFNHKLRHLARLRAGLW